MQLISPRHFIFSSSIMQLPWYVRGALAEFFSLALLPLVFLAIYTLSKNLTFKKSIFLGFSFALLILNHPLIAFPSAFFMGAFIIFLFFFSKNKVTFAKYVVVGILTGLSLSAFFGSLL